MATSDSEQMGRGASLIMHRRYRVYIVQDGQHRLVSQCGTLAGCLTAMARYFEAGYTVYHDVKGD